ncbi:MAG: thiamine diphosphokinase [Synergistaceae bacterium]|jgi:thiamine pyrophosphokinase|nr:thiamine diphosphokinase [Synergistaceae bacterium]
MSCLSLPQADLEFEEEVRAERLLVLGGRTPAIEWLRRAASGRDVWAVDRGAEFCRAAGIEPVHALGDFDSIGKEGREWLERLGIDPERYPADKDYTDFQLALRRAGGDLLVTGCWGGRFDHAFANVFSALWGREWGADIRAFADESEVLVPLFGRARLALRFRAPPLALSLLPLSHECEAGIRGTKWELDRAPLLQERPYAISNVPAAKEVVVEIGRGAAGVYCVFGETV